MKFIENEILPIKKVIPELATWIERNYLFSRDLVEEILTYYLKTLKDDLYVFMEFPYVDKIYRDTFYNYFSMKLTEYHKNSIRLSFFIRKIDFKDFRLSNDDNKQKINEIFGGFMIIRPTLPQVVGRSILSPKILKKNNFNCCLVEINTLVNGLKLNVEGFPYSSQDTEMISCAETTILNVMEYFGNRYPEYSTVLPSKIIRSLEEHSYQRQLPTSGLSIFQISTAVKKFGFGVRLYSVNSVYLNRLIGYYIDSGLPIIVALENEKVGLGHAVIYIGHGSSNMQNTNKLKKCDGKKPVSIFDSADITRQYVAIDDNFPPYQMLSLKKPTSYYNDPDFRKCKIVSIVVPLYQKIHMEAFAAREIVLDILKDPDIGWSSKYSKNVIFKLFLTSSRSYKEKTAHNSNLNALLRELLMYSFLPKFVWICELYESKVDFLKGDVSGLILLDATEPSADFKKSLILVAYPNVIISTNEKAEVVFRNEKINKFNKYVNNLKGGLK